MKKYPHIKTLKQAIEIISEQDRMIGELTRRANYLQDSESKRQQWLDKAKREAGYDTRISFDNVWAETLAKANKIK
jgi:hypothetical protein